METLLSGTLTPAASLLPANDKIRQKGVPRCCELNACVHPPPPKFICWSPNLQCDGIWRRCLWEVIRVRWGHEGISPLEGERWPLSPSPPHHHVRTQRDGGRHQKPNLPSSLILDLLAFRTVRNQCLPFKPPSLWYLLWRPELSKTQVFKAGFGA